MSSAILNDVEARQNTPYANAHLVPTNIRISYDIEILRTRIEWSIRCLEETLGQQGKLRPLRLEPGYLTIKEVGDLMTTEDEVLTTAVFKYKPGRKPGTFLVVGITNHLLFDRRTAQFIFDPEFPLQNIKATPSAMVDALQKHYGGRLFFMRMVGDLGNFANSLDIKEKQKAAMPQVISVQKSDTRHNIYTLFYEQVGKALQPGRYLLFVVKDQYNSEFKETGLVRAHSWYGYFVRAVEFPCSCKSFMAQVNDESVPHDVLFKGQYRAAWTLNDHSLFATSNPRFALSGDELYLSNGLSLDMLRWIGLMQRDGPMGAGSFFFVSGLEDGKYEVMIHRCYDAAEWNRQLQTAAAFASAAVGLGALVAWLWGRRSHQ